MDGEQYFGSAYDGSRELLKNQARSANPGFGVPVNDHMEKGLDLNEKLVTNKATTYFFRMKGDAMQEAGIFDGDILIVDRSVKLANGKIIVAVLNGELLVRRFHKNFTAAFLVPENTRYKNINLSEFSDFVVWGEVTYVIHTVS
jgi:DNA polymerase V